MILTVEKVQQLYKSKKEINWLFFWGHQQSKTESISQSCLSQWWPCQFTEGDRFFFSCT
ncbi:hypothetical protein I6N95_22175 [Vagococcus sp. BWB3-3]|uniref:Uncharacterized protein n=1 Tax=Vagococcus allomyrinae TaxID=2794353 RepID=A0A940SWX7_9ENTE|nr:hypothetical protein [Vagococcus allomyrinae]MBP1043740.1 hypothetical protein [Vagococcus allomyrinae]